MKNCRWEQRTVRQTYHQLVNNKPSQLTGSAAVVGDFQKFFGFFPLTYQIDIRTAKFLEKFMISDNGVCMLFERHTKIGINKSFSTYGNIHSVSDLMCAIDELFFC